MTRLTLYHRTTAEAAMSILADGFRDRAWHGIKGAFLSDVPLDANEGAKGNTLLAITLCIAADALADFEVVEDGKPYREWIVPAALINARGTFRLADEEELAEGSAQ